MVSVDLNCDMGESFGAWSMGNDAVLMDYVSSVNIACGFHAGDASTIRKTVELAVSKGVAIGAHPSYPDLQGFGRRNMSLSLQEAFDVVLYQVAALKGICEASGAKLRHVKPHGALYNQAAKDKLLARSIAEAVLAIDDRLALCGLAGSHMVSEAEKIGLFAISETFADRTYKSDGSLTPRSEPNSLIHDVEAAARQALRLVEEGSVESVDGPSVAVKTDTICIHGDGEHAVEFAQAIKDLLTERGITITRPHR